MAQRSGAASLLLLTAVALGCHPTKAAAQAPGVPPAVGVVRAERQQMTQSDEFIGRIQAVARVALVARVTAFLEKRLFVEGSEVKRGDLLYQLEQPPFQAQVDANKATVAQLQAQQRNAELTLERAQALLHTPAGQQSTVDAALASEQSLAAQVAGAQAQLRQSQINLGYTEIRAPIDGKISSTSVTEGNVVSPTTGTLATIVAQHPMYVIFPIALRAGLDLRNRYATKGGLGAVAIKLRLPDGRIYGQTGRLDYVAPTVAQNTDTITLRGVIANPVLPGLKKGDPASRELVDGEFVTVLLEGVQPITVLAIPRAAVLSDQQGDYVYVVDAHNRAQRRPIQLGQSTPATAVVTSGLTAGELVISEGLQRVRPGEAVAPAPASPPPTIEPAVAPAAAAKAPR
ncbi:MAG TPA: efflux RND transporter periplasmic adaptor subunit [Stellaceae bacterium]|nr:efflux RND transporter periplasmic adaptor subunit [Stellaceae bacterium]